MSELVKEIQAAEDTIGWILYNLESAAPLEEQVSVGADEVRSALCTLRRVHKALLCLWKPIDENTPYDTPLIFRTPCGNVREDFIWDEDLGRVKKHYTHYMEIPLLDEDKD